MPGIGLPSGGIRSTPGRAVLSGGIGILVVTVAFAVSSWQQGSSSEISSLAGALVLGVAMTVTGLVLRIRERRRSQMSGSDAPGV